jgi:MtaA/CmuA family methyltransferase
MNSHERLMARLQGAPVDRIPNFNIFMQFAAHYIGQPLSRYYLDYRVLADANAAVQRDFHLDLLQAISDPYRETADLGSPISFPEDGLPVREGAWLLGDEDIAALQAPDPGSGRRMSDRLEAIRLMKERAGGEIPVMGWVEGALAQAADVYGFSEVLLAPFDRGEWLGDLLEFCCEVEIAFARAQVAAGADIIGLGDAIGSQVSKEMYAQYALPYEQRIFAAVKEMGALSRLHICGNTTHLLPLMSQSGADIIDIDWMVDMGQAAEAFGPDIAVCGNQDPVAVMLNGTPDLVREKVRGCMAQGGANCISTAGCEIPDGTPAANLLAQAEVLAELGQD